MNLTEIANLVTVIRHLNDTIQHANISFSGTEIGTLRKKLDEMNKLFVKEMLDFDLTGTVKQIHNAVLEARAKLNQDILPVPTVVHFSKQKLEENLGIESITEVKKTRKPRNGLKKLDVDRTETEINIPASSKSVYEDPSFANMLSAERDKIANKLSQKKDDSVPVS